MSALPSIRDNATPQEAEHAGALYEAYSGRILGYCLRRLPNREEAEDAVQHTFMNALRGLRQGVVPRSEAAWLFKIATRVGRERQIALVARKLVEFFRAHPRDHGKALRVSRYLTEDPHVRFSVWNAEGVAEAAVSLEEAEADRLVDFLAAPRLPRPRPLDRLRALIPR